MTSPQLSLTQKLLKLIRDVWCKLCDTLTTIFLYLREVAFSDHTFGVNTDKTKSLGVATKKLGVESLTMLLTCSNIPMVQLFGNVVVSN